MSETDYSSYLSLINTAISERMSSFGHYVILFICLAICEGLLTGGRGGGSCNNGNNCHEDNEQCHEACDKALVKVNKLIEDKCASQPGSRGNPYFEIRKEETSSFPPRETRLWLVFPPSQLLATTVPREDMTDDVPGQPAAFTDTAELTHRSAARSLDGDGPEGVVPGGGGGSGSGSSSGGVGTSYQTEDYQLL